MVDYVVLADHVIHLLFDDPAVLFQFKKEFGRVVGVNVNLCLVSPMAYYK